MTKRIIILICAMLALVAPVLADETRSFRLVVAPDIESTGLMAYLLPRFALKTGRRAELVAMAADANIGPAKPENTPVLARDGAVYALTLQSTNPAAVRFADWLTSEIGQRTIAAFKPESGPPFTATPAEKPIVTISFPGDAVQGALLARHHCGRCHRVSADRTEVGIGSTPSFPALRALADWGARLSVFHTLNPHPAFLRIAGVSPPFDTAYPPPIVPVELTLDEVAAIQAYVAALVPADLGAELGGDMGTEILHQ
ncbi:MAG: hypothetical protein Q8P60_06405 [Pseudorhodobacter sp.]|nr:hypothetical protein [Pseudorhodobacter sp.]